MSKLTKEPQANVITKEEFEERIEKVFHVLWDALSKSFGPYGAPTLIYNYPYSHITKDGYTIMKNLSMNASESILDQAIADMAADICGRLNYSVGDGTTSAVIATNSIYKNYRMKKKLLDGGLALPPRDIIKAFNQIKDKVVEKLKEKAMPIRSTDMEALAKNIYDVVYISSNGDETMSEYISEFYKELGCPSITCEMASDGITKHKLITGYQYELSLLDKLYINSDNNTMYLDEADIIIFDTKVTESSYKNIIKPLNEQSRARGRHLIIAAPSYDELALTRVIRRDLNKEFNETKSINLVLTNYRAISAHTRRLRDDFAVLCNTTPINMGLQNSIIDMLKTNNGWSVFNLDSRDDIPGLRCMLCDKEDRPMAMYNTGDNIDPYIANGFHAPELIEDSIRVGYAKNISLGLHKSVFHEFYYNEGRYEAILKDAKDTMEELQKKYQKLGTFTLEVTQAQQRYYALRLKMGIIEVGADSELSQKLIKDSVDDAIKAAASAYDFGVIKGCNVDLIRALIEVKLDFINEIGDVNHNQTLVLMDILIDGFKDVYKTVLSNAFDGVDCKVIKDNIPSFFEDRATVSTIWDTIHNRYNSVDIKDLIIDYSVATDTVFDVTTRTFTDGIVNSEQTDEEILKATIELIGLLMTGNQMVITQKHNF